MAKLTKREVIEALSNPMVVPEPAPEPKIEVTGPGSLATDLDGNIIHFEPFDDEALRPPGAEAMMRKHLANMYGVEKDDRDA